MAPEQLEALDVDARTDIFAFGAMLFEMITGRKAFVARTQASLIGAILRDDPPALSSVGAVTPPALDRLSPDERWMVYTSDEAGRSAIYVRPFPNVNGGKWRVSGAAAGFAPRWRADGREIFYVDEGGRIMAVPVTLGEQSPDLGLPQALFRTPSLTRASYAVSRDGARFLLSVPSEGSRTDVPLSVVLNWPTLLLRK